MFDWQTRVAPMASEFLRRNTPHLRWSKFFPGHIVVSAGALAAIEASGQRPLDFVCRHILGDWGDIDTVGRDANDAAIAHEGDVNRRRRVRSEYRTAQGVRIWVVTTADRSTTTVMIPFHFHLLFQPKVVPVAQPLLTAISCGFPVNVVAIAADGNRPIEVMLQDDQCDLHAEVIRPLVGLAELKHSRVAVSACCDPPNFKRLATLRGPTIELDQFGTKDRLARAVRTAKGNAEFPHDHLAVGTTAANASAGSSTLRFQ